MQVLIYRVEQHITGKYAAGILMVQQGRIAGHRPLQRISS